MEEKELAAPGDLAGGSERPDGRHLRRERNVAAVIEAVLEMFHEEALTPTIERAAERSGLSLRSVYRYFPDPEMLVQAAIDEVWRRGVAAAHLSAIGEGPFVARVVEFASMRVQLYELIGPAYRAGRVHAPRNARIRADMAQTRRALTEQFEQQFWPELEALPPEIRLQRRQSGDIMSQPDVIDLLRRTRRLTVEETIDVVVDALRVGLVP